MTIVIWLLYAEVVPLRKENRRLRDEVGELSVEDETLLHAIAVRTDDESTTMWRIWIPEGRAYELRYASGGIPKRGFPTANGTLSIRRSGETWIKHRLFQDPVSGRWMDRVSTPGGSMGHRVQGWVDNLKRVGLSEGVPTSTAVFQPDQRVLIERTRISTKAANSDKIEDPSDGYMIWLEPLP